MKKVYRIFNIILPLLLLVVTSCSKKEGAPEKRSRIDEVLAVENRYENGVCYFKLDTYVEEDWNWDGKEVYRIDYYSDHPYSENLYYGSHRRIVRTTIPAYDLSTELFYNGNLLDHIDCYRNELLLCRYSFIHSDDLLTEIDLQQFHDFDDTLTLSLIAHSHPLSALLGTPLTAKLVADGAAGSHSPLKGAAKEGTQTAYHLTWTENNVTEIACVSADGTRTIKLTYDDMHNPYNQLFAYRELNDPIYGFEMLSENNIRTIRMPDANGREQLYTYNYEYADDFPAKRTFSYTYLGISNATLDTVTYTYEKIQTFHYID